MRPPRAPLVLLLLLAAERTARGTFPEEPGPITVAPEDCECLLGVAPPMAGMLGGGLRALRIVGGDTAWRGVGDGVRVLGCACGVGSMVGWFWGWGGSVMSCVVCLCPPPSVPPPQM